MSTSEYDVTVETSTVVPTNGIKTDTGQAILVAPVAEAGVPPTVCGSTSDFVTGFGARTVAGNAPTFDWLDAFFREGGAQAVVAPYAPSATPAQTYDDALTLVNDPKWGPGQLAVIGTTPTSQMFTDMQTYCQSNNAAALRDCNVTDITVALLETLAGLAPANDDLGATFASWVNIPAPAGVIGASARQVPASAIIAALCARVDAFGNPNRMAAGDDFPLQYVTGFVYEPTSADRATLLGHGVNTFATVFGALENYGFQTNIPASSYATTPYWQFNPVRGRMYLKDRALKRGQTYYGKSIDGQGKLLGRLQGDLMAECADLLGVDGLYNDAPQGQPQNAYSVNVGSTINTAGSAAQGQINASANVVWSMGAVAVDIDLVTIPIGGSVS